MKKFRTPLLAALAGVAAATSAQAAEDPLRPLTAEEVVARTAIRSSLLGGDPEGERAAMAARAAELGGRSFATPEHLERRTLRVGAEEREYFLFVPRAAKGEPSPVVFGLHGAGSSSGLAQHWKSDYTALAEKEGFVVVYPSGVRGWNFDPGGPSGPRGAVSTTDDVGFFAAMFDRLIADGIADPKRIYVTGGSGGGFMTWSLMHHLGDRIAATGIVVAALPRAHTRWPPMPRPIPTLLMLGTIDPLIPWEGIERGHSAADTVRILCERNGCQGEPEVATLPDRDPGDGVIVETATWTDAKAPVVLYRMNGHGHGWPMTEDVRSGPKTKDFVPIEALWAFLREHTL
jgi:polyhydroxybutyrate depolymerase